MAFNMFSGLIGLIIFALDVWAIAQIINSRAETGPKIIWIAIVAFLFDDITSEITLTRKFRAELTLGSQVLDGLGQALIVFNAVGQVVMTNKSYTDLWGPAPGRMTEALHIWRGEWAEAPGLAELERELAREDASGQDRGVIFGPPETGVLGWTVSALPGGKRMVRFTIAPPVAATATPSQDSATDADALPVTA